MRIYEINTRVHCDKFSQVSEAEFTDLAKLGFDSVWFMGIWEISPGVRRISKLVSEDFEGSPYAVPDYKVSKRLGGKKEFVALVERAHRAGLSVIVDFVSNHMAIDSPWIDEHPEYFITSNTRVRSQATSDYFLHPSGNVVAFGKDPYFPPWHDTSQLDYTSAALRRHMTDVLKRISRYADGVRCDMAMLLLRDYIRQQWYPLADQAWFDQAMPGEFWEEAIAEVKKSRPEFKFIAEAYWHKEAELIRLGFDLAYEKQLYDGLVARDAGHVRERILLPTEVLSTSLYFTENHDEPRAATVFNKPNNLASVALILSLPGSALIHEGQMEGFVEKLPVQRLNPVHPEVVDDGLRTAYQKILTVTTNRAFTEGRLKMLETSVYGVIAFARVTAERVVAYIGQISDAWHSFNLATLNLTDLAIEAGVTERMRLTSLLTNESLIVKKEADKFIVRLKELGLADGANFCLLEASPA